MKVSASAIVAMAAAVATVGITPPGMTTEATAQVEGDEKCSPDGYVMKYNSYLNQWDKKYFSRCTPGGSRSGNRQSDNDEDERSSSRSRYSGGNTSSSGEPQDGDEKCVGGYILKFHRYETIPSRWGNTYRRC